QNRWGVLGTSVPIEDVEVVDAGRSVVNGEFSLCRSGSASHDAFLQSDSCRGNSQHLSCAVFMPKMAGPTEGSGSGDCTDDSRSGCKLLISCNQSFGTGILHACFERSCC